MGREEELATLEAALTGGQVAAVCGLAGLGGIGKSALAAHFASLCRDRFPDGVLYASLRDLEPLAVLGVLAQAYGADLAAYPDLAARLAAVRSLLSDKRALIILDNAEDLDAVRQILPCCGERCAVLVTTRDAGLAAAIGQVVRLPVLAEEDSLRLLKAWAGDKAVEADPAAAGRACELLGHLPLAVEIAAKLAGLRGWRMGELERRLRAERGRLELLKLKDLAVRTSFQLSYDLLDEGQRAFFAALGAFRGLSFDAEAAAAVAEVGDAAGPLEALGDRSLVWQEESGRFRQHPLLADYALERLREAGREAALLERHARHYVEVARAANDLYKQGGEGVLGGLALFDLEWPQIRQGQAWAAGRSAEEAIAEGQSAAALASDYPDACIYCLDLRLPPRDRIPWLEAAAAAARRLGDKGAEGGHLGNLGIAYCTWATPARAIGYYEQALAIAREIGDRRGEGTALGNLGMRLRRPGRRAARHRLLRAGAGHRQREIGDRRRRRGADLGNLGLRLRRPGRRARRPSATTSRRWPSPGRSATGGGRGPPWATWAWPTPTWARRAGPSGTTSRRWPSPGRSATGGGRGPPWATWATPTPTWATRGGPSTTTSRRWPSPGRSATGGGRGPTWATWASPTPTWATRAAPSTTTSRRWPSPGRSATGGGGEPTWATWGWPTRPWATRPAPASCGPRRWPSTRRSKTPTRRRSAAGSKGSGRGRAGGGAPSYSLSPWGRGLG